MDDFSNQQGAGTNAQEVLAVRLRLLRAGYTPLPLYGKEPPIYGKNNSRKGLSGWQKLEGLSPEQLEMWTRTWPDAINTGVLTRNVPAFDADILDEDAARAIEDLVREHYEEAGHLMVRIGRPPKRAFLFRADKPFPKIAVNFVARSGAAERLEFLCDGQQVVVAGIHPDTHKPYRWFRGEPGEIARADLPLITEDEARELIERAAELLVREFGYVRAAERSRRKKSDADGGTAGTRERAYAKGALRRIAAELAGALPGTRNDALNKAAFVMGTMVARGWVSEQEVEDALRAAMERNGYIADKGGKAVDATLASGLKAGKDNPHDDLPERGIELDDFVSHAPSRTYFFLPCREPWPGASVNTRLPKIEVSAADGGLKMVAPSAWLDLHRSVEQMTWCPGEPDLIPDKLFVAAGGWIERRGVTTLNLYRAPTIEPGNAAEADLWVDHVYKVYPADAEHIIHWLAHRVQRPAEKINHALVLGGAQGIGKDTLLEPAKYAVGPWNVSEISPAVLLGRFNGFLKSVILRVSEAHDLGEFNRFALYERLKAYTAAPPDGLRIDEKNMREYTVVNCCGVVITSNHSDGLYLPADDRRHYVAWSELTKDIFTDGYWRRLWGWYDAGGLNHVAAYLGEFSLAGFDPKAPPPKTPAFWQTVGISSAPEEAELADLLDKLGNPDAVTLAQLRTKADVSFDEWLSDRRNRRVIPHRMNSCGYVSVRNPDTDDGLWRIRGVRQAIYAKVALPHQERFRAARQLAR